MQTWVIVPLPLYLSKLRSVQHQGIQLYGVEAVDYSFDVFLAYADLTEGLMDAHGSPQVFHALDASPFPGKGLHLGDKDATGIAKAKCHTFGLVGCVSSIDNVLKYQGPLFCMVVCLVHQNHCEILPLWI